MRYKPQKTYSEKEYKAYAGKKQPTTKTWG